MRCTNCQGEWTPPANQSLGKCPFCHVDILQMLNEQAEVLSTEVILANMLQAYGTDLLQNQQRLSAMISDLFAHDHKTKRLLLLSVRENIPTKLLAIQQKDTAEQNTHILALQRHLAEEAFLKEEVVEQIVKIWSCAMRWKKKEVTKSIQIVSNDVNSGIIEKQVKEITPIKYDDYVLFVEALARVKLNSKYGFIDKKGKAITPIKYEEARSFSEGLAKVKLNGKWGFIDIHGNEVISIQYDYAMSFSEGLATVKLNGKWGFIDNQGNEVIPILYDYAMSFSEGLAIVRLIYKWDGVKYGFIDKQGNEVIPIEYDYASSFSEGLASIVYNRKYGFINKIGIQVTQFQYDYASSFSEGLAEVELNGKFYYIDINGNWVKDK